MLKALQQGSIRNLIYVSAFWWSSLWSTRPCMSKKVIIIIFNIGLKCSHFWSGDIAQIRWITSMLCLWMLVVASSAFLWKCYQVCSKFSSKMFLLQHIYFTVKKRVKHAFARSTSLMNESTCHLLLWYVAAKILSRIFFISLNISWNRDQSTLRHED